MNTRKQQRSLFYAVDVLKRMEDEEEKKKNSANNVAKEIQEHQAKPSKISSTEEHNIFLMNMNALVADQVERRHSLSNFRPKARNSLLAVDQMDRRRSLNIHQKSEK